MTFVETNYAAKVAFYKSTNSTELNKYIQLLLEQTKNKLIDPTVKNQSYALYYQIQLKVLLLGYYASFSSKDYESITKFIAQASAKIIALDFKNTLVMYQNAQRILSELYPLEVTYSTYYHKVCDNNGICQTSSIEELKGILTVLEEKMTTFEKLPKEEIFPPQVKMPSFYQKMKEKYENYKGLVNQWIGEIVEKKHSALVKEYCVDLTSVLANVYEYYPIISTGEGAESPVMVISSPIVEEVYLYALSYQDKLGKTMKVISSSKFEGKTSEDIHILFDVLKTIHCAFMFTNMSEYHGNNRKDVLKEILTLGTQGIPCIIHDSVGNRGVYNECFDILIKEDSLATECCSNVYLSMPSFTDLVQLFLELKMIPEASLEIKDKLRRELPYMGFIGLNKAVNAFYSNESFLKIGHECSLKNESTKLHQYIQNLPYQTLFIDKEWGDFSNPNPTIIETRTPFDYDNIKYVNEKNVRKIVEGNYTLIQKCGALVRYVLYAGDDIEMFKQLPEAEKEGRVTEATILLYRLFGINYTPATEFLEKIGEKGTVLGMCCSGGKLIQYKKSHISGSDGDILNTILHECRHSFQNYVINTPYQPYLFTEFGITKGMIEEWILNENNYQESKKNFMVYQVQVIESDARAFATDAIEAASAVWSSIDFE